jgi:hypothetical protein
VRGAVSGRSARASRILRVGLDARRLMRLGIVAVIVTAMLAAVLVTAEGADQFLTGTICLMLDQGTEPV